MAKTLIELAKEHCAEEYKTPPLLIMTPEQLEAYSRALVAPFVEALKLADEAMMWDVNGEPIPTKEVEARAKIADALAAYREMFGGE